MATIMDAPLDNQELARRWAERCQRRNFSPAVKGASVIAVMGESGDERFTFPRVTSLAVLNEPGALESDEAWAVRTAQQIFEEKRASGGRTRQVVGRNGSEQAVALKEFNPDLDQIMVLSMTAGG